MLALGEQIAELTWDLTFFLWPSGSLLRCKLKQYEVFSNDVSKPANVRISIQLWMSKDPLWPAVLFRGPWQPGPESPRACVS